jgi:hypothetical protein
MRKPLAAMAIVSATICLTGCGGGSVKASRDCFAAWNHAATAGHSPVAGHFTVARVSDWTAQAEGSANLGGPASHGCGYLFHTSTHYLSISGRWNHNTIQLNVPPPIHGSWSPAQQAAASDNANVDSHGLLKRR